MANIIKHQGMQRHGTAWAESLRYRQPHFEAMGGLRRITLNCNTLIGDRGAAALALELAEDLWVKAVDLQRCGLSSEGARRLLEALKTNSTLCVLDIRNNPLVDKVLIKTVIEKVLMNADGQSTEVSVCTYIFFMLDVLIKSCAHFFFNGLNLSNVALQYCWIKPATTEPQRAPGPKKQLLPTAVRRKATFRIATCKETSGGQSPGVAQAQKPYSRSGSIPWHAAARAGRQRGLPPGGKDQGFQGAATVKVTVDSDSEGEEEEEQRPSSLNHQDRITERQFARLQIELKECRLRLTEERRARLKAESRLMTYEFENARLRDAHHSLSEVLAVTGSGSAPSAAGVLEDEAVLESIESSFTKFHAFLDLLKDAGLGQLASMAGIDKSDFQPLGRPQLSSTGGTHFYGAASLNRGEVQTNTDALSWVSKAPPSLPCGPADTTTPRSSPSVRECLQEDGLLDVSHNKASGPVVDPSIGGEGEPDRYSRPNTQHDSGSEHSFLGRTSSVKVALGETQKSEHKSNSNSYQSDSHHSKGSHGYSNAQSHASYSNGSHGGLSVRSSVSDIMSDKAESVGSAMSRNRGNGRLVTIGQSGSEGSEGKAYLGRETLEQIRTLAINESF
uniref:Centrosomal protein of 78 kDa n=1 Tax=Scophthalmus maximus TaxID=52904 RepID=A0A8D3CXA9_SCOMX